MTSLTPQGDLIVLTLPAPQCWYIHALIERDMLPLDLPESSTEGHCITMQELETLLKLAGMPGVESGPH